MLHLGPISRLHLVLSLLIFCAQLALTDSRHVASTASASPHRGHTAQAGFLPASTDTAHYQRTADGHIQVQLYNIPVALPDQTGWRLRELGLGATQRFTLRPAHLPFDLQIATTTTAPALATISSDTGVSLRLALPAAPRPALAISGRVATNGVTFPAALSGADLSIQPTIAGFNTQILLHGAHQAGSFAFSLILDPRTHLARDSSGAIVVSQPMPLYTDEGRLYATEQEPEYIIEAPLARDSSSDPAALSSTTPVTVTLTSGQAGVAQLAVQLDPSWLQDPRRVFPIQMDLPIQTAGAAFDTGLSGTVSSCAPSTPASPGAIVVGTLGACTYHGLLYFDVSSLWAGLPIQSATLNLYALQTGQTGVQLLANAPPAGGPLPLYTPLSWQPPSWSTSPQPAPGTAPIAQSAGNGHWQQWDVTGLVRSWVNNRAHTNGGLTLEGGGATARFATALAAAGGDPAQAPYLTITLGQSAYATPEGIFGMVGIPANGQSGSPSINPPYTRIGPTLGCGSTIPDWSGSYAQALDPRVVLPLFVLVENYSCGSAPNSPQDWQVQVTAFIDGLRAYADSHGGYRFRTAIFEIGNEPDTHADFGTYPAIFSAAAQTVNSEFPTQFPGLQYVIYTGGVTAPIAQATGCAGAATYNTIQQALTGAAQTVPSGFLGIALHPYSYATGSATDPNLWLNYRQTNVTGNPCFQLGAMINLWQSGNPQRNIALTEINYSSQLAKDLKLGDPTAVQRVYNSEGSYLVDLFTWMYNRGFSYAGSPVCLFWFSGNDFPYADSTGVHTMSLGIYTQSGADKFTINFSTTHAPGGPFSGLYCPNNAAIHGQNPSFAVDFRQASLGACYAG